MHLGLIGGIGPAATVAYYLRLVAAFGDAGVPLRLTIAHADIGTLAQHSAADDRAAQAAVYAGHLSELQGAGATCAAITSLGGHFCYAETEAQSPLPLISAIDPIEPALQAAGVARIGLLGSRQVLATGLYGALGAVRPVIPDDIGAVHETYVTLARSVQCSDAARDFLFDEGAKLIARGADAVLLAGTDLGLAFDGRDPGFAVIDAVDIHVAALLRSARG